MKVENTPDELLNAVIPAGDPVPIMTRFPVPELTESQKFLTLFEMDPAWDTGVKPLKTTELSNEQVLQHRRIIQWLRSDAVETKKIPKKILADTDGQVTAKSIRAALEAIVQDSIDKGHLHPDDARLAKNELLLNRGTTLLGRDGMQLLGRTGGRVRSFTSMVGNTARSDEAPSEEWLRQYKRTLLERPPKHTFVGQNDKMSKSSVYIVQTTLPALKGLVIDERQLHANGGPGSDEALDKTNLLMVSTCPGAGVCVQDCYVAGGRFPKTDAFTHQNQILSFLLNHPDQWQKAMVTALSAEYNNLEWENEHSSLQGEEKAKSFAVRWHESGDFFSDYYIELVGGVVESLNKRFGEGNILHYAYSKSIDLLKANKLPAGFVINQSFGSTKDKEIDPNGKYSLVIPRSVWSQHEAAEGHQRKLNLIPKENEKALKDSVNDYLQSLYGDASDPVPIYMWSEVYATPSFDDPGPFHVVVTTMSGDDSATDPRCRGTLLLVH